MFSKFILMQSTLLEKKQRLVNFGPPTASGPCALHTLHTLLLRHWPLVTDYDYVYFPKQYTCVSLKRKTTRLFSTSALSITFLTCSLFTPLGQSVVRQQLDLKKIILRTIHTCHTFYFSTIYIVLCWLITSANEVAAKQ